MESLNVLEVNNFLEKESSEDYIIVDVRTPEEFNSGHIKGALNIPLDEIGNKESFFEKDKKYLLYCRTQGRSQYAHKYLSSKGFDTKFMIGGIIEWIRSGFKLI